MWYGCDKADTEKIDSVLAALPESERAFLVKNRLAGRLIFSFSACMPDKTGGNFINFGFVEAYLTPKNDILVNIAILPAQRQRGDGFHHFAKFIQWLGDSDYRYRVKNLLMICQAESTAAANFCKQLKMSEFFPDHQDSKIRHFKVSLEKWLQ